MTDDDWLLKFEERECAQQSAHGPHWWRDDAISPGYRCLGIEACPHGGFARTCRNCAPQTVDETVMIAIDCPWCDAQESFELPVHAYRGDSRRRTLISVATPKRSYGGGHKCSGRPRD